MSGKEPKKNKKKASEVVLSWQQKMELANKDEEALRKEVDELSSWANMIGTMDDNQLKEYVLSMPKNLQSGKAVKSAVLGKKPRRGVKPRVPSSSSLGIIASVWKFHKEDDEEGSSLAVPD